MKSLILLNIIFERKNMNKYWKYSSATPIIAMWQELWNWRLK